jgi:amidase
MQDLYHAFCNNTQLTIPPIQKGRLTNLYFAIKDNFDITNLPTAFGNKRWLETHEIPNKSTWVLDRLLKEGACFSGKTQTDELTYSILGIQKDFKTPINPNYPDLIPGGSSSGSAVAVAGNVVDFAIGSDTGGSVRVPAAVNNIWGIRTSHNLLKRSGMITLAKSFDTIGWFSRSLELLNKVGEVLIDNNNQEKLGDFIWPEQIWNQYSDAKIKQFSKNFISNYTQLKLNQSQNEMLDLTQWGNTFRIIQGYEIWQEHGEWVKSNLEYISEGVKERLISASQINFKEYHSAQELQSKFKDFLINEIGNNIWVIPTLGDKPPKLNSSKQQLNDFRQTSFKFLSITGLAGLVQINIPFVYYGLPYGISVISKPFSDKVLLDKLINLNI